MLHIAAFEHAISVGCAGPDDRHRVGYERRRPVEHEIRRHEKNRKPGEQLMLYVVRSLPALRCRNGHSADGASRGRGTADVRLP